MQSTTGCSPVSPKETESAYVELARATNLDHVFSERSYRKIGAGNTLSYGSKIYTLATLSACRLDAKMAVEERETLKGEVDSVAWRQSVPIEGNAEAGARSEKQKGGTCAPAQTRRRPSLEKGEGRDPT